MPVGRAALCVEMKMSEQNVTEPQRAILYVFCINMQDLKFFFTKTDSVSVMQKSADGIMEYSYKNDFYCIMLNLDI